jgi:hypothetical protein
MSAAGVPLEHVADVLGRDGTPNDGLGLPPRSDAERQRRREAHGEDVRPQVRGPFAPPGLAGTFRGASAGRTGWSATWALRESNPRPLARHASALTS